MKRGPKVLLALGIGGLTALGVQLSPSEAPEPEESPAERVLAEGRVRVEVLNGGGVTGMARAATEILRDVGFDVVEIGNTRWDPERRSSVIDRVGRADVAQAVAAELGIDNVQSDPDPNLYVDVSVVLGSEWTNPTASVRADPAARRPVWDLRGWFGRSPER